MVIFDYSVFNFLKNAWRLPKKGCLGAVVASSQRYVTFAIFNFLEQYNSKTDRQLLQKVLYFQSSIKGPG